MEKIVQGLEIQKYLDYLKVHGASDIEHSGEDFLSHLQGTMDILVSWEADVSTLFPGLFNSVYGTCVF